jgi:hypothetical protein
MSRRLSPAAFVALKDALSSIYWYKADLRSFLHTCLANKAILARVNWDGYKRQIIDDLLSELGADQDANLGDLTRLCYAVADMKCFDHLLQLEGGKEKAERGRLAVQRLQEILQPHDELVQEEQAIAERRRRAAERLRASGAVRERLSQLSQRYSALVISSDHQSRGFELEKLMYDLFELFDLDPKASFRNTGEQVDGAFSLEGTDYLFEAKWQKEPVTTQDLDAFASKTRRKLENTLGVFLSINGYSADAVLAHSSGQPSIILIDGSDLMAVLEGRIDFVTLLVRKKRHAAQTGNIYLRIHEIV